MHLALYSGNVKFITRIRPISFELKGQNLMARKLRLTLTTQF